MRNVIILCFVCFTYFATVNAQNTANVRLDSIIPVRGVCIAVPSSDRVDDFVKFINEELATRHVNTLILRVDYNYQYESHPELRDSSTLSKADIKKIVKACQSHGIIIIPQINMLGHQSWAGSLGMLLKVYPEFDETPHVKMPEKYDWPNADNLYCKSYCPLHPGVHKVLFELIDEMCDVFETSAFHAGMDEVFYLGDDKCPRCAGGDKAELFANEVRTLRDHLNLKGRKLWIWGDRLIDGKTTGMGMWEASYNSTYRAVDMIPKDVVICDWHYDRPEKTPVYFSMKGFDILTCPWRMPDNATLQVQDMASFRASATPEMKIHYRGMLQTIWSGADNFLDEFYGKKKIDPSKDNKNTEAACFRATFEEILKYQ